MSTANMSVRLKRIEDKLQEIAPVGLGLSDRLRAAREARAHCEARDEQPPLARVHDVDGALGWPSQDLRRRLNAAGVRMFRQGSADYAAFAELAALTAPPTDKAMHDNPIRHVLDAIVAVANPPPTTGA